MDNQLLTLSKIFTERLFRIPDYQRGYAWSERQLKDFWSDIAQLEPERNHYTGVLTLENVPPRVVRSWADDEWIVNDKNYNAFYVVDGQQRLTTAILLIQVIIEKLEANQKLNHNTKQEIQKKFVFDSKDDGISRSYIFGYEKDNPSYEFLKSKIFKERITSGDLQETVYTQNLDNAKKFFEEMIEKISHSELELIYKKVTQNLLFNIFTISEDVDVCVAFETMNNRGKPLSYLELLKNRLIYLSYKLPIQDSERLRLRSAVNDCWRAIYHNLGRNKAKPLDDDRFLFTHYIVYFGRSLFSDINEEVFRFGRFNYIDYPRDLLERRFIAKNVLLPDGDPSKIDLNYIFDYVSSLQDSIETWYKILNPEDPSYDLEVRKWLDKLNRIGFEMYLPMVLTFFKRVDDSAKRVAFLKAIERHLFIFSLLTRHYPRHFSQSYPPSMVKVALDLQHESDIGVAVDKAIRFVNEGVNSYFKNTNFIRDLTSNFRSAGFYGWEQIKYFLYEYNLGIQERSKSSRVKIDWEAFNEDKDDYVSVEHIYPQKAKHAYWKVRFNHLTAKRKALVRNSLGNLLPLSKPKNSSLSNRPFDEKVSRSDGSIASYAFGSYAENEVAQIKEWDPAAILDRGLSMLAFMEKRWGFSLGSEEQKKAILGLDFIQKKR